MHLTNISARNLKGASFDLGLTPAMVLVGDNFAGKTRVADAIRLLLIGYLPELGKLPRATFGLASGPSMEVAGTFSDGSTIRRRWFLKGDTVKTEEDIPPQHDGAVSLLTVMLNAEEYFSLTDRQRVEYVAQNCPDNGQMTIEAILTRLEKAAPAFNARDMATTVDDYPPIQFVEAMIQLVTEAWKNAKDNAKRMEETVRGLTALRTADEAMRPVPALEDAVAVCEKKMAELQDRKNALMEDYNLQMAANTRRAAIARELGQVERDRIELATQQGKLVTVHRELDLAPIPTKTVADCAAAVATAQGNLNRACERIEELAAKHRKAEQAIAEIDSKTECPFCGATGEGWKALRAAELVTVVETIQSAQQTAMANQKTAREALAEAIKIHEATKEASVLLDNLRRQEQALCQSIAAIVPRLERAKALEEERDRLAVLNPQLQTDVQMITTELTVAKGELTKLAGEIKGAIGRQHDLKRLADAEAARDKAKVDQEAAATAGKELRVIQGEMVAAIFAPLLLMANRIFAGVLLSPLAYRDGEIGTWRDGIWIGHRTMSGTEKLLTYAAIQAALAAKSPVRLMILDELGRLTYDNADKVARTILGAIDAGLIDQFLGIDPERPAVYANQSTTPKNSAFTVLPIK